MKRIILGFTLCFLIASCKGEAESTTIQGDFKLELLFEKDGCKMYRFNDGGRNVYWSDCSGNTTYRYKQGKVTMHKDVITNN